MSRLFLVMQTHQFVVLFDGLQRLHEHGLAAGGGAVRHSRHPPSLFHFDRNHEALAANGNQFVLDGAAIGQSAQVRLQRLLDRVPLALDIAASCHSSGEARSSSVPSGCILLRK